MVGRWDRLLLTVLLLSNCDVAFAVKSLKLNIPRDQAIVIKIPPDQWVAKETSWTEGIPISILRAEWQTVGEWKPPAPSRFSYRKSAGLRGDRPRSPYSWLPCSLEAD